MTFSHFIIIDKKSEILGYEKNLNILYYSFYDDEQKYYNFSGLYGSPYGPKERKQELDNFYNDLVSKFDGIYNNLKNSSNQSLVNSGNKNIDESISELRNKINSHLDISNLYSYKYLQSNLNGQVDDYKNILKYDEGKNYVNQLKNDINDRINKLTSLLNDYNIQINNSGYNTLSNYKTTDLNYSTIVSKINSINTTFENKLNNLISSFGNTDKDDLNSRINKISSLYYDLDFKNANTKTPENIESGNIQQDYNKNITIDSNTKSYEDYQDTIINTYQLNEKEKSAVNIVANKINKMSNIKKNKYKNLLNKYLNKFDNGSRKYEIVKGVLNLIK